MDSSSSSSSSLPSPLSPVSSGGGGGGGNNTLVLFDFDHSLITDNSDTLIFERLSPDLNVRALQSSLGLKWTQLMHHLVGVLHERGFTKYDIQECMRKVQVAEEMRESLNILKNLGCDMYILSDANTVYIEEILFGNNLQLHFTKIFTNPAYFDEKERLNILPYHSHSVGHGCGLCPPNLCKGLVLQDILKEGALKNYNKIIYLGDGAGDLCPVLKMTTHSKAKAFVLARKNWALHKLITEQSKREKLELSVLPWENYEDVLKLFKQILSIK